MDDLISRKHFDERIRTISGMVWDDLSEDYQSAICVILQWLKLEPSVNPQKVGKWIEKHGTIVCSECGWYAPRIETGCLANRHLEYHKSKYCWNCGAKMEDEK